MTMGMPIIRMELERAQIAYQLGKRYDQDEMLKWGCSVEISDDDIMKFKSWPYYEKD